MNALRWTLVIGQYFKTYQTSTLRGVEIDVDYNPIMFRYFAQIKISLIINIHLYKYYIDWLCIIMQ